MPSSSSTHIRKSLSVNQLAEENDPYVSMNLSTTSLSKSLGAKVFSDENFQIPKSNTSNKYVSDEGDEFVDASETQIVDQCNTTWPTKSSDQYQIPKCSEDESFDKMYVVSSASIKYDCLPCNPNYTR